MSQSSAAVIAAQSAVLDAGKPDRVAAQDDNEKLLWVGKLSSIVPRVASYRYVVAF